MNDAVFRQITIDLSHRASGAAWIREGGALRTVFVSIVLGICLLTGGVFWLLPPHPDTPNMRPIQPGAALPPENPRAGAAYDLTGAGRQQVSKNPDWSSFALIVVDVQVDFWNLNPRAADSGLAGHLTQLLADCRSSGIEVIHVRSEFDSEMTDWPPGFKLMFINGIACVRGTDGARPAVFATETADECVFIKHNFDSFSNVDLTEHLKGSGKRHLLVAGLSTDVCILSTALSAINQGYMVSLVDDCCFAESRMAHAFIVERYDRFLFDTVGHRDIAGRHLEWSQRLALLDEIESRGPTP